MGTEYFFLAAKNAFFNLYQHIGSSFTHGKLLKSEESIVH